MLEARPLAEVRKHWNARHWRPAKWLKGVGEGGYLGSGRAWDERGGNGLGWEETEGDGERETTDNDRQAKIQNICDPINSVVKSNIQKCCYEH